MRDCQRSLTRQISSNNTILQYNIVPGDRKYCSILPLQTSKSIDIENVSNTENKVRIFSTFEGEAQ